LNSPYKAIQELIGYKAYARIYWLEYPTEYGQIGMGIARRVGNKVFFEGRNFARDFLQLLDEEE